jgi:hypothetical protein
MKLTLREGRQFDRNVGQYVSCLLHMRPKVYRTIAKCSLCKVTEGSSCECGQVATSCNIM